MTSKAKRFRDLLESEKLEFICEAHNGISAKIVEEAGFKGIWGSGLTISAQYGVRDNNEASWTQVLDNLEFMSDASEIPILLDGDTGYGNFNNFCLSSWFNLGNLGCDKFGKCHGLYIVMGR